MSGDVAASISAPASLSQWQWSVKCQSQHDKTGCFLDVTERISVNNDVFPMGETYSHLQQQCADGTKTRIFAGRCCAKDCGSCLGGSLAAHVTGLESDLQLPVMEGIQFTY